MVQALPRGRSTLDDVVRALVELGVERITPVSSTRTVRELRGDKRHREHERWEAVAVAAARQARRARVTRVDRLAEIHTAAAEVDGGVVAHLGAARGLSRVAPRLADRDTVAVAVGPEGGWTDEEVDAWCGAGLVPVSLGETVLRSEHAAFATCAALSYAFDRMTPATSRPAAP